MDDGHAVIAWDPGVTLACAAWGHQGLLWHVQGSEEDALRHGILWMRENRSRIVAWAVEALFVGVNARSSLSVAESAGRICGAAWACGISIKPWRPLPSEWRKDAGFLVSRKLAVEETARTGKDVSVRELAEALARKHASNVIDKNIPKSDTHLAEAICLAEVTWKRHWSREWHRREAP